MSLSGHHLPQPGALSMGVVLVHSPPSAEHGWEFDARAHDRAKGILQRWRWLQPLGPSPDGTRLNGWVAGWDNLREEVRSRMLQGSSEAGPAFMLGMMTGDKSALPRGVRNAFSEVGLGHLTAVSGFHVGLVLAGWVWLFRWAGVRSRWRAVSALPGVWGFVLLCGLPASAARAAVMATVWGVARCSNRRLDGLTAWSLAGWLLVRDRPEVVHDVGAQLSFAATLGILMWHRSRSPVGRPGWWRAVHSGVAISVVATVFTAPVAWPTFGRLPVVFPLANLLAAPSAMVLAGLGGIQVVLPDVFCVKALAAWCSATFVNAVVWMAEWRPAIRLPLEESVLRCAGGVLCGGVMLGFLRNRLVVWSGVGVVWAALLLRAQAGLEAGVQVVRWESGAMAVRTGCGVTVFSSEDAPQGKVGTWKTRSFVERVSTRLPEPVQCVGGAFKMSPMALQVRRENDTLVVTRSSPSRCGSLDPHTSPRLPCP